MFKLIKTDFFLKRRDLLLPESTQQHIANKQAQTNFIANKGGGYIPNYSIDTTRTGYTTWYYNKSGCDSKLGPARLHSLGKATEACYSRGEHLLGLSAPPVE
jgi:hypothetical protein